MNRKVPGTSPSGHYTAENAAAPVSEPTWPGRAGCSCISPRIYEGGKVNTVCARCGLPHVRRRR